MADSENGTFTVKRIVKREWITGNPRDLDYNPSERIPGRPLQMEVACNACDLEFVASRSQDPTKPGTFAGAMNCEHICCLGCKARDPVYDEELNKL